MDIVTLDYETFWSATHDIKKCGGPIRYVLHPDTEIQSCAIKINDEETFVVFGDDIIRAFADINWKNAMALGHNMSGFDALIMAWRHRINPKAFGCTLAMARPFFSKTCGNSLKAVADALGVGQKLSLEATNTKGKRLADFTPNELVAMTEYNKQDTELCYAVFKKLLPLIGTKELKTIDYTTRMTVHPKFELDVELLENTLAKVKAGKLVTLERIADQYNIEGEDRYEAARKFLASNKQFAQVLEDLGVPCPMKISKTTGKETYALAKTDQPLLDMLEHEDDRVQSVVAARLDVKSTILETRMQSFMDNRVAGRLPMPLAYAGADTTGRWSGQLFNPQNLPRINPDSPKYSDALRSSLKAPKGYKVVVADCSGIELRINHFLWKVPESMEMYQKSPDKADLYKAFAADLYGISIEEVTKIQRQTGKIAQLQLGFGSAHLALQKTAKIQAGIWLETEEAKNIVDKWRKKYAHIANGWKSCGNAIASIASRGGIAIDPWEMCITEHNAVRLPSGRQIVYPNIRRSANEEGRTQWYYGEGRHKATLYSGKLDENLVQALARDVVNDNAHEYHKRTGRWPCLCVHDELIYVVKEDDAEQALSDLQEVMRTPPTWWPELVVWSEGDCGYTYGDAK